MTFKCALEQLINALSNNEDETAISLAESLLTSYPSAEGYRLIDVDNLVRGLGLENIRLRMALSKIISKSISLVDFGSFCEKYDVMIRANAHSSALHILIPEILEALVPNQCTPEELVQSRIFPFMVMHLTEPHLTSYLNMECALLRLIRLEPNVAHLIDRTLAILASPNSSSDVYSRLLALRFTLAVNSESVTLVKLLNHSIFPPSSERSFDVLLLANVVTIASNFLNLASLRCLQESGFVDSVAKVFLLDNSLTDIVVELFIKCVRLDQQFVDVILHLSDDFCAIDAIGHPLILQLKILIYKYSGQSGFAEDVCDSMRNGTSVRQLNAVYATELLFEDDDQRGRQESFFRNIFPDAFEFISQQIPLKAELQIRQSFYDLLRVLLEKEWLMSVAVRSEMLIRFLTDRALDPSVTGLGEKYLIVRELHKHAQVEGEAKRKLERYLAEGVQGIGRPIADVSSRINQ